MQAEQNRMNDDSLDRSRPSLISARNLSQAGVKGAPRAGRLIWRKVTLFQSKRLYSREIPVVDME